MCGCDPKTGYVCGYHSQEPEDDDYPTYAELYSLYLGGSWA